MDLAVALILAASLMGWAIGYFIGYHAGYYRRLRWWEVKQREDDDHAL